MGYGPAIVIQSTRRGKESVAFRVSNLNITRFKFRKWRGPDRRHATVGPDCQLGPVVPAIGVDLSRVVVEPSGLSQLLAVPI